MGADLKHRMKASNEFVCLVLCLAEEILDLVHVFYLLLSFLFLFVVRLRMEHSCIPN